ncbi:potassium channel family protein [Rugosimonospora africana]|uniref:Potassium channel domain-containing protein n=1 Tax=Rugosimonospora africana TaxID=556532 RepID=A0A8J3QQC0_9ACTN|nr:potassium channel family protein [Rugosimonospora africana]GIH13236.1 hypothetical protein Raf01_14080 [Rugosimonospora africana]
MGDNVAPQNLGAARPASDRYDLVFALLVASFLLTASLPGGRARVLPFVLYVAALTLALRGAFRDRRVSHRLLWTLLVGSAVAVILLIVVPNGTVHGVVSLWVAAILVLSIVAVVRRVLAHRVVTMQTIFGALSAYLLIGFLYAALFSAVSELHHTALFAHGQPANSKTIQYFSFITMTTVGYGDFTAASEPARTLAVFDALSGQIFLVTLVARLVSIFGTTRSER